jgi:hypothetical protein
MESTKEMLEKIYGTIPEEIYSQIIDSVNNDMQQIVVVEGIPNRDAYYTTLCTNTEFFLSRVGLFSYNEPMPVSF